MKQRGRETSSTRLTIGQRCLAAGCLIFALGVAVEGLLMVAGVIHGTNGAGEDLSTAWNVLLGLFTAAVGTLLTVSQVEDLRTGKWTELPAPGGNGGADDGDDAAIDLDDVDDGW
jgi:hypothetical protein